MAGETYNGWANYETWATALHIDNEEGTYLESRQIVRDLFDDGEAPALYEVMDALKEWAEGLFIYRDDDSGPSGLATDLLQAAWGEVDWHEIATNYLDEVKGEAE